MSKSIAVSAAMLVLVSCNESIETLSSSTDELIAGVSATSADWIMEADPTRALSVGGDGSLTFSWAEGDVLGIYPIGGDQVSFPISDGAGTATALFDGGSWALRSSCQYAAYYPFCTDNYTISQSMVPISLLGQTQNGNNSLSTASSFDYQAAAATLPDANGYVNLSFQHLCAFMKLKLTVAKPGTYTHVRVTSDNAKFGTKATFDLTSDTPALSATETSESVEMDLANITTTTANELVIIYNLAVPVDLVGSNLTIELFDNKGFKYVCSSPVAGKNMVAGHQYGYAASISGTGVCANLLLENGHEYVDLGLKDSQGNTIYWATCNVGAASPEDYGLYFQWGSTTGLETNGQNGYQPDGYRCYYTTMPFNNGSSTYNTEDDAYFESVRNTVCPGDILAKEYDAAYVNWGGSWRMPTNTEFEMLTTQCTWTKTTLSGIVGYKVQGPNGNYIFFPCSGYRLEYSANGLGNTFRLWCSTLRIPASSTEFADVFYFPESADTPSLTGGVRYMALPVRPVRVVSPTNQLYGHEYVDLGITNDEGKPIYWATCNIGAASPEESGNYFAWGEIEPKNMYTWDLYKWSNGIENSYSKYCTDANYGTVDNKTSLELCDDAARQNWGGTWRMPTKSEWLKLNDNCTFRADTVNGVTGYRVIGKNGKSIFMGRHGARYFEGYSANFNRCDCWLNDLYERNDLYDSRQACTTNFYNNYNSSYTDYIIEVRDSYQFRYYGLPIRPVCE